MSQDTSAQVRTLSRHEVMDLVRAGIVLAITVVLTMIVPPQVWGADPEQAPAQVVSPK
jgi:hypothetical protein